MSKLLQFANFQELINWSVKTNLSSLIESKYKVVTLGNHIIEQKDKVKPFDFPEDDFKILGVSNKVGLFDNEIKKGKEINQAYKIVKDGYLAYNPYRINVGSIGIKTEEHKYDLISPAYVVFSCKATLLPEFLFLIFKTQTFNTIINESTRGSVRQILAFDILETLKIPLPTIAEQKEIVNKYNEKLNLAKKQGIEASQKESDIEKYLFSELNFEVKNSDNENNLLQFVKFKNISRWDTQSNYFNPDNLKSNYKFARISELIKYSQYGLSEKADLNSTTIPFLRMNNIQNGELNIDDLKYISLSEKQKENYLLDYGDILFNRTNSKELVGKSAVFKLEQIYSFASYLIRLKLNNELVNNDYFVILLNSSIGRMQIDATSRQITGQVNINVEELKSFLLPLPSVEIQEKIVRNIEIIKNEIKVLRDKALSNKQNALNDFESEIFNETE